MNNKEFRALANGTATEVVNGLTSEILDTVKQGGITKMSEIKPNIELMVKELFGNTDNSKLVSKVIGKIDNELILVIKD
jgi:hypothetical protein